MAFNFTDKIVDNDLNCTLIVDALNLAFRWKHQGRTDFRYEYQRTVESLAKSYDCKRVIITADLGSSTYRKEINPEYKQNRKEKFADQTEAEKVRQVHERVVSLPRTRNSRFVPLALVRTYCSSVVLQEISRISTFEHQHSNTDREMASSDQKLESILYRSCTCARVRRIVYVFESTS